MTSQLLRAACALTFCLAVSARVFAAESAPSQAQVDAARRQYFQALQQGDFTAAERYDKELKALEARLGTGAPALASAPATGPVSTFFSAPPGSPAAAPGSSSSVFTPPNLTTTALPPPAANSARPSATLAPAPQTAAAPAASSGNVPPPSPATPPTTFTSTPPARPATSPFTPATLAPAPAEEPRPVDVPPAVIELRAAQAELSKLEEFRMAESLTTRRGAGAVVEPLRPGAVPPPAAVMAPTTIPPLSPSVNLAGGSDDLRRKLDDLTRRKSELQLEAERLSKDSADWEARYNAAKAELARLEAENKNRDRLQTVRDEISRLDADATRLMQDIEASRADQDRRAREMLTRVNPAASATATPRDRPTVPASASQASGSTAPKGPPQFLPVGSSRPATMAGDGNILRTGRSGGDPIAIQRELDKLDEKREVILRELDEVQLKFNFAQRELATAGRTGVQADIDRWTKETAGLDSRYKNATAELAKLDAERAAKITAMKGAITGGDPDTVNPGDSLRLLVAEDDSYNAIYPVKRDGNITVKGVGRVAVGGKGISEAEAAVKALLEETQLTKATVTLEFVGERKDAGGGLPSTDQTVIIYLAGEFITPGPLKVPDGVAPTLITTIIRSGGVTPSGDLTRAKLLRIENGQGAVEEVNVAAILSGNLPPTDIALNPGDIIMIPAFAPVVYVTGNVNKPGTLRLFQDETLTAYAAILRAGGFSRFANLKKCSVVRDLGNGEKMQLPLNVKEIIRGLAPDVVLQGKDIVVVPESFFSF